MCFGVRSLMAEARFRVGEAAVITFLGLFPLTPLPGGWWRRHDSYDGS